jgi:hypothetical protein
VQIGEESTIETVLKVAGEAVTFRFLDPSEQAPPPDPKAKGKPGAKPAAAGQKRS